MTSFTPLSVTVDYDARWVSVDMALIVVVATASVLPTLATGLLRRTGGEDDGGAVAACRLIGPGDGDLVARVVRGQHRADFRC
jgi:hypothetical protein